MSLRGLLGAGLVWLSVGHAPDLGLPQPAAARDSVRQMSDAWRGDMLKSLLAIRRQLQASRAPLAWDVRNPFVVAGKSDGEAAVLTGRLASAGL